MTISIGLTAGNRNSPLGLPAARGIMLGWSFQGEGSVDIGRGVDVEVAETAEALQVSDLLWVARGVRGSTVRFDGAVPASRQILHWRVKATAADGSALVSDPERFEIGLEKETDWSAKWVSAPLLPLRRENWDPIPLIRHRFVIAAVPSRARVYASALGVYRLWINGHDVTAQSLFRPGWTDYRKRVLHQTYDVTPLMQPGENAIAVELSKGWYAGWLGLQREPGFYGDQVALRLQVEGDGVVIAATDETWKRSTGEVIASDMLRGESQDLRQTHEGWISAGFDDTHWLTVAVRRDISLKVTPQSHDPVATYLEHQGRLVRAHARGPAVYDFGQNIVGWTRLRTRTHPKADIVVRHGERLNTDELVWRDNLRSAFQEDRYTTGDSASHELEPRHTIHGFQFAEVWGLVPVEAHQALEVPEDFEITAISVSGGQRKVGSFECSDERLTRVSSMVEWTVRDNFIEVITDCPQRDERLGWLGDAGVIAETAAYHFDVAAFVSKFARDAADSQAADGMIRSYVPPVPPGTDRDGAPGWADGYVRLVHLVAERYGDLATADEHIDHIGRYLDLVDRCNPSGIRTERVGSDFSDWLSLPEDPSEPPHPGYAYTGARSTSSKRVVATAHTIRSFDQYAEILRFLGREEEASIAEERARQIRQAYIETFIDDRGWIEGDTQTVYAQAIGYGIVRGELRAMVGRRLAEKVEAIGHVTVGIHGSEHILPALADTGRADLAELLLLREEMPSWKHMAAMGATTVWEKWDAFRADGTHSTAEMNSLNHCALGAVGEFLFERVAGITARSTVRDGVISSSPLYLEGLSWVNAEHETVAGPAQSSWSRDGNTVVHDLSLGPALSCQFQAPSGWTLAGGAGSELRLGPGHHRLTLHRG